MAVNMDNVGAKYPAAFTDADGDFLSGDQNYKLHVPKDVPVALFWSVTVYDPITGSDLDNGQPFPSLNTMDEPVQNTDGTIDVYFGPKSPGEGKNRLSSHAELHPDVVAEAKRLRRANPNTGDRLSYRQISGRLAESKFLNERGQPYNPKSIRAMLGG